MADTTYYVDTDVVGGAGDGSSWANAYDHLADVEALNLNLTTGATDGVCTVYCRGTAADTTAVTWNGWTTDASGYVNIVGDFAGTTWDTSKFRLSVSDATALTIQDDYVRVGNIQIEKTSSDASDEPCISISAIAAASLIHLHDLMLRQPGNNDYEEAGLIVNDADAVVKVWNVIFVGTSTKAASDNSPFVVWNGIVDFYNCTAYGGYRGFSRAAGTVTCTNCVAANQIAAGSSFNGTITVDYCCSDDGTGTNSQTPNGGVWSNEFATAGSDFALISGGNCVGTGLDDPGAGLFADDITGTDRTSVWDIGADEYVASAKGLAGSVTSVCSIPAFLPYIYHELVDDDVDATGTLSDTLPEIHHYLIDDDIDGQSLLKDTLPEVHHYLVNDVIAGQSSVGNLLPYIYHTLVNSVVAAAGGISSLLPYIYHTLVNSVTAGVSTLIGNLITLAGGIEWALSGAISGVSSLVDRLPYLYHYLSDNIVSGTSTLWGNLTNIASSVGSKLRIYMRIGRGRF